MLPGPRALNRLHAAWWVLLALAGPALGGSRPRIVVLKSSDLSAYGSVVAGFTAEIRGAVEELTLEGTAEAANALLRKLSSEPPALVLAIGPAAANAARRAFTDVPILFCMVPYFEKYGLEAQNVTGIALTTDLSAEFAALKAVAPKAKRVGILHDPRYSAKVIEAATALAAKEGFSIVPIEADGQPKAERALGAARGKLDAMLTVADKTVASSSLVKRLNAYAADERLPLVGLSSSQVREGALLSLSPSYLGVGQQAARLANRLVHEKVNPGALAVAQPELLELALNLSVAKRLGQGGAIALDVLQFAAAKGYPIKVFP